MAVRRSLAWMAVSQIGSFILQFGSSVILARLLTPYDMGVYAVAGATAGALSLIQAFGLGSLIVREHELTDEMTSTAFTINALGAVTLSALIFGMSFAGGAFLRDSHVKDVLLVLAVAPLFAIVDFLPAARFEREGNFKAVSIAATLRGFVSAVATVTFAVLGYRYMGLAFAQVISAACASVYLNIFGRKHAAFKLGLSQWKTVLAYGVQILTLVGVAQFCRQGCDIVLGRVLGIPALGIFDRAGSLNNILSDKIRMTIERVAFSHFSSLKRQGHPIGATYLLTVEMMTAVLWPAFIGLAIIAGPLIYRVYGERWIAAALPLSILSIAAMIQVSISMTWEIYFISGELARQTRIEVTRSIVAFAAFAIGCFFGFTAAASTRILDAIFGNFLYRSGVERMTDTRFSEYLPIYGRSLLLSALAVSPAGAVMLLNRGSPQTNPVLILASVAMGGILWFGGLAMLRHPLFKEFLAMANRRRIVAEPNGI